MSVHIVDVGVGTNLLIEVSIHLAAPYTFTANADEVVFIQTAYQRRCLPKPLGKRFLGLIAEGTRFITYLPRHDGRIVAIGHFGITVGTAYDVAHILKKEFLSLSIGGELADKAHVLRIAGLIGARSLTRTSLFQIETVTPAPLPCVVQIEHGLHAPLTHLL